MTDMAASTSTWYAASTNSLQLYQSHHSLSETLPSSTSPTSFVMIHTVNARLLGVATFSWRGVLIDSDRLLKVSFSKIMGGYPTGYPIRCPVRLGGRSVGCRSS
jgi:hypothetical protein